jgi:hypothetical protein
MPSIDYSIVEINPNHYLRVLKCFSDKRVKAQHHDTLFVIIPGNPGLIEFYEHFAVELATKTNHCVIGISHTGHLYDETIKNWNPCNLRTQIKDKVKFIENHLIGPNSTFKVDKNTKLVFVGHSIGCHVILQMLNGLSDETKKNVKKTIHLFPTFERMAITPNGRVLTFASKFLSWLIYLVMYVVTILPGVLKRRVVDFFFTKRHHKHSLAHNIDHVVYKMSSSFSTARSCFHMGADEMKHVLEFDEQCLEDHADIILLYYGQTDKWFVFLFSFTFTVNS